jgi:hypothetical protein
MWHSAERFKGIADLATPVGTFVRCPGNILWPSFHPEILKVDEGDASRGIR